LIFCRFGPTNIDAVSASDHDRSSAVHRAAAFEHPFQEGLLNPLPGVIDDLIIFLFGACIGSFLNVCIYRIPESKSIVTPRSSCPRCGTFIKSYDNIPIVSWAWLGGKCRHCRSPIPIRYPMVELLTGMAAVSLYIKFGPTPTFLVFFLFVAVLLMITFIDIDHQIIPNIISLPGIPIFFALSFAVPDISWIESAVGILVGGGSLYLVAMAYQLIKKAEGMGMGDMKLLAMIGALIGWKGVLFTVFVSSALGAFVGGAMILIHRGSLKTMVPYGPYISIGAIAYIFFGPQLIDGYFRLVAP
jgi:leader peptidase (prepilin peptidase)/N-methyltransferase